MNAATATAAVEPATERLGAMVADCRAESQDDLAAAKLLLERAKADDELYAAMLGPYEWLAAREAISRARKAQRGKIWHGQPGDGGASNSRVAALVRVNSSLLLDFPLHGGLPLKDANKEQVAETAAAYKHTSKDAGDKGRWLARVAKKVPKGKLVGDVFDEDGLAALRG